MKAIMQQSMAETAEWEEHNPVLWEGVIGIEKRTDGTRRLKIGDGKASWNELPYFLGEELELLINAEAQARAAGDSNLQTQVDAEAQARATGDSNLQTQVDAEAQARATGDSNLQTQVDNRPTISDMNVCDYNTRTDAIYEANAYTNEQVGSLELRIDGLEGIGGQPPAPDLGHLLS